MVRWRTNLKAQSPVLQWAWAPMGMSRKIIEGKTEIEIKIQIEADRGYPL
jgi:hypothetical protein